MQSSDATRRETAKPYHRHCERSEAIHCHLMRGKMDCFASLAMTRRDRYALRQRGEGCQRVYAQLRYKT
jgi:hypothetical protein